MKYFKVYFLLNVLLLIGCNENAQKQPEEDKLTYANEQEKLLNEAFLDIVGTDLCYTIAERYLLIAQKISDEEGEKLGRNIFDKYKIEDTSKVIIFTKDKFLSRNDWYNKFADTIGLEPFKWSRNNTYSDGDTLEPSYLPYIKQQLVDNHFIRKNDSSRHILDSLSKPLKISTLNFKQTGCFKIVRLKDRVNIKGRFRTFGTFNCSRIYIDQASRRACLFYEKNCLGGTKCAAGSLIILKKQGNKWKVIKEVSIYVT